MKPKEIDALDRKLEFWSATKHQHTIDKRNAALVPKLLAALKDAEFLMRKASQVPGPMQDSFRRSAYDARIAIAAARGES